MKKILSGVLSVAMLGSAFLFGGSSLAEEPAFVQTADSQILYDENLGYYKGIAAGTTVDKFLTEFDGELTVSDPSGNAVSGDSFVGSDYTVNNGDVSRSILVYGDVNRDGERNISDALVILKVIAQYEGVSMCEAAADVDLSGGYNISDVLQLLKVLAKWDGVDCGYVPWTLDLGAVKASSEDESLEIYFTHSTVKDGPEVSKPNEVYSYELLLAKNESEGCHVNLYSEVGHKDLNVSYTQFTDKYGNTLETEMFFEDYLKSNTTGLTTPDILPPVTADNVCDFDIKAEQAQGLYIKATSVLDSPAGLYRAKVEIKNASNQTIKRAYVYASVWDFELPVETTVKTAFGMSNYEIYKWHDDYTETVDGELYAAYYEYFLDNRINIWCMPYEPTSDEADKYMSDPRVNTFLIAGGYPGNRYGHSMDRDSEAAEYIAEAYAKLSGNEEWASKGFFYMVDEPLLGADLQEVVDAKKFIDDYYPNARTVVPHHLAWSEMQTADDDSGHGFDRENNYPQFDGMDTYSIIEQNTTIMCPSLRLFPTSDVDIDGITNWYSKYSSDTFGDIPSRLAQSREAGKEIWWYTANSPASPMTNISLNNTGMENRVLFWQQYDQNVDGMLYWETTEWTDGGIKERREAQRAVDGTAGILVYSGKTYGIDGPIGCLRTEIIRDGLEDIEYLTLAEKYLGTDVVDEYVSKIVANIYTFETDEEVLAAVRAELGDALEKAIAAENN